MGRARVVGTAGTRAITGGRVPQGIGLPIGKSSRTRPIPAPPIKRKSTHCESHNKQGQPCKAPLVKGQRHCQGHLNQIAARRRRESDATA